MNGTMDEYSDIDIVVIINDFIAAGYSAVYRIDGIKIDVIIHSTESLRIDVYSARVQGFSGFLNLLSSSVSLFDRYNLHQYFIQLAKSQLKIGPVHPNPQKIAYYRDRLENMLRKIKRQIHSPKNILLFTLASNLLCLSIEVYCRCILLTWYGGCDSFGLKHLRIADENKYNKIMSIVSPEENINDIISFAEDVLSSLGGPLYDYIQTM